MPAPQSRRSIVRHSLHHELSTRLREMIIDGELKPGEKIPEVALSERFGVSRTPLREALKALAAEGLVQLLPNRGAIVAKITEEEIDELFPILGALEALAGEMACRKATDRDLKRVRKLHDDMLRTYEARDEAAYRRLNKAIHEAFFEIAGNSALTGLYHDLSVRIHSARYLIEKRQEDWRRAVEEHERIIDALERRETRELAQLLRDHLTGTATDVSRMFLERQAADADA